MKSIEPMADSSMKWSKSGLQCGTRKKVGNAEHHLTTCSRHQKKWRARELKSQFCSRIAKILTIELLNEMMTAKAKLIMKVSCNGVSPEEQEQAGDESSENDEFESQLEFPNSD